MLISISFLFIFSVVYVPSTKAAIPGCFCGGSSSCYSDGCTRKTIKADGSIDYGLCGSAGCGGAYNCCYDTNGVDVTKYFCIQQPPCCADMVARNDPEACCWPERGYCHPFYCNQVSRPERCGWYWSFHGEWSGRELGYGCTKGTSDADLKPVYGLPAGVPGATHPTSPPQPTKIPTAKPTQYIPPTVIPTSIPTQYTPPPTTYIPPTVPPVVPTSPPSQFTIPTNPPLPTQMPTVFTAPKQGFAFPSWKLPVLNTEPLKIIAKSTIIQSEKVMNIPSEATNKIIQLDSSLEFAITSFIQKLIADIFNIK